MKNAVLLSLVLTACTVTAQTPTQVTPVPTPVRPAIGRGGVIGINPNQNQNPLGTTVLSNVVGIAGNTLSNRITNPFALSNAMVFSNLFGSGDIALGDVEGLLQTLQVNIEQALPLLASLTGVANNGTGAVNPNSRIGTANTSTTTPGTPNTGIGVGTAGVGGVNVGNTTVTTSGNPGQNTTTTTPNQSASRTSPFLPPSPILPATGNPNQPVTTQGQAANTANSVNTQNGQVFFGTLGTNTFQMDAQTFQQLIFLRNTLQQALPLLQNLNNSAALENSGNTVGTTSVGGFTNRFTRTLQNRGVLLPTGR
jgi:hypothetical protein